jgi:hypothetical protein
VLIFVDSLLILLVGEKGELQLYSPASVVQQAWL